MRQLLFSVGTPRGAPVHANGYINVLAYIQGSS